MKLSRRSESRVPENSSGSELRDGWFGRRRQWLREMPPSAERANEQSKIAHQNDSKGKRGKKLEVGAASFHNLYAQHCSDEAARQKPDHQFALRRREGAPGESAGLDREPASKEDRSKTAERQDGVLA